ncbi:MAG TPA: UrcA family protein [Allosphingosinicella sp.]|nr:UrcA family protein [Allosphingosinicella sp.]
MSPRPLLVAVAAVAVALGATTMTVGPAYAASAGVLVRHNELNLASAAGRAVLDARIERAARIVCGTALNIELDIAAEIAACRAATVAAARQQLRAARGDHAVLRVVGP